MTFGLAVVLAVGSGSVWAQSKPAKSAGEELVGLWVGSNGRYRSEIEVAKENGQWNVEMRYLDQKGELVGLGRCSNFQLNGGQLSFKRVLEKKPVRGWLDTISTIEVVDGKLKYVWRARGL